MSKDYETRINALKQKLIPQLTVRTDVMYIVDEEKEDWINGKEYIRPDDKFHDDFINELRQRDFVSYNIVTIGTVRLDDCGMK